MKKNKNIIYNKNIISNFLKNIVLEKINNNNGWISFSKYMKLVLYTKKIGYYNNNFINIGKNGDYITSPELSSIFSETFAYLINNFLKQTKNIILEIGAGSGQFAFDLLNKFILMNITIKKYLIFETSETLCNLQKQKLKKFSNILWLKKLPKTFSGVLFANEVLDCFPVDLLINTKNGWLERGVSFKKKKLIFLDKKINFKKYFLIEKYNLLPIGYITEVHLECIKFIKSIVKMLLFKKNIAIFIDYGYSSKEYYLNTRIKGTLMCHNNHYYNFNPFYSLGFQDITSHVNFTAISNIILKSNLNLFNFYNQSSFLLNIGNILNILYKKKYKRYSKYLLDIYAIKKMVCEFEMGELFKVLIFGNNVYLSKKYYNYNINYKL